MLFTFSTSHSGRAEKSVVVSWSVMLRGVFFLEVAGVKMMFYDEVLLLGLYAELILRRKRRKKILDEVIYRNSNDMACRSLPSDGANNTYPL